MQNKLEDIIFEYNSEMVRFFNPQKQLSINDIGDGLILSPPLANLKMTNPLNWKVYVVNKDTSIAMPIREILADYRDNSIFLFGKPLYEDN